MKDYVKVAKYEKMYIADNKYKKYMCYNCSFYINGVCSKNRAVVECAKNHLKNQA